MTQDNNYGSNARHSEPEQIDLIDLFTQLWAAKKIIIAFVIVALILGGSYAFLAKQKWTSTAIVTLPSSGQITSYYDALVTLNPNAANTTSIATIQTIFFGKLNDALTAISMQLQNQLEKEDLEISPLVKGQSVPLQITYSAGSAEKSQKMLNQLIEKANKSTVTQINSDLEQDIASRKESLATSLKTLESVAQVKKDKRLNVLTQALTIAESSNIKTPRMQQGSPLTDDVMFLLGSDALKPMIEKYKDSPLPLDQSYYATQQNLLAVNKLKGQSTTQYSFRYVMEPDQPIHRDSPKRSLILILSVLLGGIIGSAFVLGRNAIRTYKQTNA